MWKPKKGFEKAQPANFNIPLGEMSQKQIKNLRKEYREAYFYDKTTKRSGAKSGDDVKRKGNKPK